jgi:hypothetical protein
LSHERTLAEPAESRRMVALVLLGTAIAAAGALIALRLHFQPPTVPPYVIATPWAEAEVILSPNARFEIELRPATPVEGAIAARGFLLRGDEVRPWDPPFSVSRDGSVLIAGRADTLFAGVPLGSWEVALAIGRPEVLPTAPRDVLRARTHDPIQSGWHLIRERIRLDG